MLYKLTIYPWLQVQETLADVTLRGFLFLQHFDCRDIFVTLQKIMVRHES